MSVKGKVVWHDLYTGDVAAASAFYRALFDWDVRDEGHWNLIYATKGSSEHFGAIMALRPEMKAPPHWLPYFAVEDLDAGIARVKAAGGKVHTDKMAAGKTGTFAVAADAEGAAFMLWHYLDAGSDAAKAETQNPPSPGSFVWDELMTTNAASAKQFYASVFALETQDVPMGPDMVYTVLRRPGTVDHDGQPRRAGGLMQAPPELPHPFWASYVAVADCDATTEKAQTLRATVLHPPTDIPNVGRFAALRDPTGAAISILAEPKSPPR